MCPKGSCSPWKAHARAGSWQKVRPVKRSPHRSRFSGRTCDSVGDAHWSNPFLKDCTLWKGLKLEQFLKDSSPWDGPTLEQLVKDCIPLVKDCIPWEGCHAGAGEEREEEGAAEKKSYEPPVPLRGGRGRRVGSEVEPGKMVGEGVGHGWKVGLVLFLFLATLVWYQLAVS